MMSNVQTAHSISTRVRTGDVLINENVDFPGLLLSEPVLKGLAKSGFERPSPIQLKAIPIGRCGLDLIVQAKSGTGKTCVFTVISLESLSLAANGIQVLVLAPTREIAVQIWEVVTSIGCEIPNLKCHTFIGGLPLNDDKVKLRKCHIGIGTPGRVMQLIETGMLSTESIRLFVLDEADKLLEENFQEQINWIYSTLPVNKQMIALSATYPEVLAQHLTKYMRDPIFVRLNSSDPALLGIKQFYKTVPFHPIAHKAFDRKVAHFLTLLSSVSFNQCLVFSNYQTRAQTLSDILNAQGWPSTYISGSQDQQHRMQAMAQLKKYQCRILISTDLTSRGIDAENVNLVVNLDLPYDHETYLHRIGRAGRFGTFGAGVTYVCTGSEEEKLHEIERQCNTSIKLLPDPLPEDLTKSVGFVNIENLVTTEKLSQLHVVPEESVVPACLTESVYQVVDSAVDPPVPSYDDMPQTLVDDKVKTGLFDGVVIQNTDLTHIKNRPLSTETGYASEGESCTIDQLESVSENLTHIGRSDQLDVNMYNDCAESFNKDFCIPTLAQLEGEKIVTPDMSYSQAVEDYLTFNDTDEHRGTSSYEPLCSQFKTELIESDLVASVSNYLRSLTFDNIIPSEQVPHNKKYDEMELCKDRNQVSQNDVEAQSKKRPITDKKEKQDKHKIGTHMLIENGSSESLPLQNVSSNKQELRNWKHTEQSLSHKQEGETKLTKPEMRQTEKRQPRYNPMSVSLLFQNKDYHGNKMENISQKVQTDNQSRSVETATRVFQDSEVCSYGNSTNLRTSDIFKGQRHRPDLFQPLHVDTQRPLEDDLTDVSTLDDASSVTVSDFDSTNSEESDSTSEGDVSDDYDNVEDYEEDVMSFYTDQSFNECTSSSEDEDDELTQSAESIGFEDENLDVAQNFFHDYNDTSIQSQYSMWYYQHAAAMSAFNMYNYYAWQNYAQWMGAYYASAYIDEYHRNNGRSGKHQYAGIQS